MRSARVHVDVQVLDLGLGLARREPEPLKPRRARLQAHLEGGKDVRMAGEQHDGQVARVGLLAADHLAVRGDVKVRRLASETNVFFSGSRYSHRIRLGGLRTRTPFSTTSRPSAPER
jgi:hypothetical protein